MYIYIYICMQHPSIHASIHPCMRGIQVLRGARRLLAGGVVRGVVVATATREVAEATVALLARESFCFVRAVCSGGAGIYIALMPQI